MEQSSASNIQYLLDRQAILDCIHRCARGTDRHDVDLLASCYHEDAVDEHGPFRGGTAGFIEWVNQFHSQNTLSHTHCITTHTCEIDGAVAHAETYCLYTLRRKVGKTVTLGVSRYLDRFERRDGEWKISVRKTYIDWRAEADATIFDTPNGYPPGQWDRSDASYQRPLEPSQG